MAENQSEKGHTTRLPLGRDFVFLILQFMHEEGLHESAHSLERDSGVFFDLDYFKEKLLSGSWMEAEWYIKGYFDFHQVKQNSHTLKIFYEIYKSKFIDALLRREPKKAFEILENDIRPLVLGEKAYEELVPLLSQDEASQNQLVETYGNLQSARRLMCAHIRKLVWECPDLQGKFIFPSIPPFRMRTLLSQSFNWQHDLCLRKKPNPVMATLLEDHNCSKSEQAKKSSQMSQAGPSRIKRATGGSTST